MRLRVVVTMLALVFAGVAAAADGSVTIDGRVVLAPTTRAESMRLTGTIPSARAGERIDILAKECGYDHYRVVSGTQSTPGGRWQVEVGLPVASSFVARWRGRRSVPFKATPKALVWIQQEESTRRWQAGISAFFTSATFVGREVELQRLGNAGWVRCAGRSCGVLSSATTR
jgi:hypothetical protein